MERKKRQISKILLLCFSAFLFTHCATTQAPTLEKQPECTSSVEGYYYCPDSWDGNKPALVLKKGNRFEIEQGHIVSRDKEGVTFDATGRGLYDPKPKYYPYDKIQVLIGNEGQVLAGKIPERMSKAFSIQLSLYSTTQPQDKPIDLMLKPNEQFGFCVPPDNYVIKKILFIDGQKNIDEGVNFPDLTLRVLPNQSNYIGHLLLNAQKNGLKNPIIIPYKIVSRPKSSSNAAFWGGMLGTMIHSAVMASKGIIGEHKLYIGSFQKFESKGKNPLKKSVLQVKN